MYVERNNLKREIVTRHYRIDLFNEIIASITIGVFFKTIIFTAIVVIISIVIVIVIMD